MKKLIKLLKGHKYLVFMDFEGTQFSHEMIALGAVVCTIDSRNCKIKRMKKPFKVYVTAKNKIGKYVVELTGITEEQLRKEGISFSKALNEFKKYVGLGFKKATFITFGNHDLKILNQSIAYNLDFPKEITSQIQRNYLDYMAFISEFIRDEKGNPLSLVHYCDLFKVKEAGTAHDPSVDAVNLANLYDAFLKNPEIVLDEYKKHLGKHTNSLPAPVAAIVKKLSEGEDVTSKEFDDELRKYIA